MNLAKSLIVSNKKNSIHRASMQWNGSFWPKISPIFAFRQAWVIRYSRTKHAVLYYLKNRTTAKTEYVMGCTVNNLLRLWVCKLSFLKRHTSIQKSKILNHRALLQWKEKKTPSGGYTPAHWLAWYRKKNAPKFQDKYGIKLPTSSQFIELNQLKICWNFKDINSLLGKTHMIQIFSKKYVQDTRW
jgi:hypothetical protein